jgi:hypothetical protein
MEKRAAAKQSAGKSSLSDTAQLQEDPRSRPMLNGDCVMSTKPPGTSEQAYFWRSLCIIIIIIITNVIIIGLEIQEYGSRDQSR